MSKMVVITFQPDVPAPKGHIPMIDMRDPYDPTKRVVSYPEEDDDGRLLFTMEPHIAAKVLSENEHVFKLWSPSKLRVARPGDFGTQTLVTIFSVNPACPQEKEPVNTSAADNAAANAGGGRKASSDPGAGKKAVAAKGAKGGEEIVSPLAPRVSADGVAGELDKILSGAEG